MPKQSETIDKLVPDTSVIIEGVVSKKLKSKEITATEILIHEAVVAELEHQANTNRSIGFLGLEEIENMKAAAEKVGTKILFTGERPRPQDIRHARLGEIDALIRDLAYAEDATLMSADKVQSMVARAKGMKVLFIEIEQLKRKLKLEGYFDAMTMSVHLRENVEPFAKKGKPGTWEFVKVKPDKLTRELVQELAHEIIEEANIRQDGFVEIDRSGSTIVQLANFRIVITRPPFSDGWEITAVRPVKHLSITDYALSEKLMSRIDKQAEGVLIAGSPGMGKSTFAQALAEHYAAKDKIVKTIEAPRDLVLPENVTQLAISHGDSREVHDVLLLSRPDYTVFDEMRNTHDFQLFADLRLSGIGLAGVVHATNPVDAIQRFVGRIELGVIPQVIDTVIFIMNGAVAKVLSLHMVVKVPAGMTEEDLARPVVVVSDFESRKPEYELYTYGEQTVVVPVKEQKGSPVHELAAQAIAQEMLRYVPDADVQMLSDNKARIFVPEEEIPKIIGKQGKNVEMLEKRLGIGIDVQSLAESKKETGEVLKFHSQLSKKSVHLFVDQRYSGKGVHIYLDDDYVLTANVGKGGEIKITRKNKIGKLIADAVTLGDQIKLVL